MHNRKRKGKQCKFEKKKSSIKRKIGIGKRD